MGADAVDVIPFYRTCRRGSLLKGPRPEFTRHSLSKICLRPEALRLAFHTCSLVLRNIHKWSSDPIFRKLLSYTFSCINPWPQGMAQPHPPQPQPAVPYRQWVRAFEGLIWQGEFIGRLRVPVPCVGRKDSGPRCR